MDPDFPLFRHVTVHRPGPHLTTLRWAIQPTSWPLEDLSYEVFRSESPAGPWDELGEVQSYSFYDSDVISSGTHRHYYYIVRIASRSGKGYRDSKPVRLEHDPDHIALEMVRKKNLYLKVKGGIEAAIFQRKSFGPKCSKCFNYERNDVEDPDCPECFGTGIAGGYLNPVLIPILFNPPERTVVLAGIPYENGATYFELANWPLLQKGDLIVDRRMNIRYRAEQVKWTSHRGHPVSQIVQVLRADDNDIIYTLSIPESTHAPHGRSWDQIERGANEAAYPDMRPGNATS